MELIAPEKYPALIKDYGISKTKEGNAQVFILFEFEDSEGMKRNLTWYGSFKEKAKQFTLDALLICGMKGNDPRVLVNGVDSNALNMENPVRITVEHAPDQNGKMQARIKWVNMIRVFNRMSEAEVMEKLPDLKGEVQNRRNELKIKNESVSPVSDEDPWR